VLLWKAARVERRMIKAVIFDMDGVIVESEHIHIEAERQTMLKHGVRISAEELHIFTGTTAQFMFTELIKKYTLDTTFEKMFNEKEEILFKLLEKETRPTTGVIELLKKLKQKDIKLAIASSSHRRLIDYFLRKLGINYLFDFVVSAEDIVHSKPNPEIFLKSAQGLKMKPAECLVVEDAKLGVEAAKKAGMKVIGYRNPNSGSQDLSKADLIANDFSELTVEEMIA
jgi:beta-phosphoglucomutase family hydrolase